MNTYDFTDLHIGMTEEFTVTVKEENIRKFFEITGDANPLHRDAGYAVAQGYPDCAVYGMLTASYLSTLGGMYLPGKRCLIHGITCEMARPVFAGDVLTVRGTVKELHESVRQAVIKVEILNQKMEKVLRGKMKAGVLNG